MQESVEHLAVIGDPIAHSLSPAIHNTLYGLLGLSARYEALRIEKGALSTALLAAIRERSLRGVNLTMPHKQDIIPLLYAIDESAKRHASVNTVCVEDGRLIGHTTDAPGFFRALEEVCADAVDRRVVFLGAGGAVKTLALECALRGAKEIRLCNRTEQNARDIAVHIRNQSGLDVKIGTLNDADLKGYAQNCDLLINGTPLGMEGIQKDFENLDFLESLPDDAVVCDLIYAPVQTKLLKRAHQLGLKTQNGAGMLLWQALIAHGHFFGTETPSVAIKRQLQEKIFS